MHHQGLSSFPEETAQNWTVPEAGRSAKQRDFLVEAVREQARSNRRMNAENRDKERADAEKVKEAADKIAMDILQQHSVLAKMSCGEWKGVNHSCPAAAFMIGSRHAQDKEAQVSGSIETLSSQWVAKHEVVPADPKSKVRAFAHTMCYKEGICHCKAGNAGLRKLLASAKSVMKRVSHPKHLEKDWVDGSVVLCWISPASDTAPLAVFYTWVGLHYLNPWRPTLLRLKSRMEQRHLAESHLPYDEGALLPVTLSVEEIATVDSPPRPAFQTLLTFLTTLDRDRAWYLRIMHLSKRHRPANEPLGCVTVIPCGAVDLIWTPEETETEAALDIYSSISPAEHRHSRADQSEDHADDEVEDQEIENIHDASNGQADEANEEDGFAEEFAALLEAAQLAYQAQHADRSSASSSARSSSGSSTSSSSESSSSAASSVEEGQEVNAEEVAEEARPARVERHVRPETFYFGSFRFTHRPP